MDDGGVQARIAAVHSAYEGVWVDFLKNRPSLAEERANAFLGILRGIPEACKDDELWVTEADFSYIVGAVRNNDPVALKHAIHCYDHCISAPNGANNRSARRMRAEALLRLGQYEAAFNAFDDLASQRTSNWEDLEVAPFRLEHDAALCERLASLQRIELDHAKQVAAALRQVANHVPNRGSGGRRWARVCELEAEDVAALKRGWFDELLQRCSPYPVDRFVQWAPTTGLDPLNQAIDWSFAEETYSSEEIVVLDEFFSPDALSELWAYAREARCFRTVRNGFLGAFPADGNVHPLLLNTALSLEHKMSQTFKGHPLGLWWLFKYTDASPSGIGIHADAAAVNVNIWLTPDAVRRSGGGLDVFKAVPPDEANVKEFNHEFDSCEEEKRFRDTLLAAGGVRHIDYKQNRAVIFVSDLFHASEPFDFTDSVEQPRVNLTFLFGDRTAGRRPTIPSGIAADKAPSGSAEPGEVAGTSSLVHPAGVDEGWDLFE